MIALSGPPASRALQPPRAGIHPFARAGQRQSGPDGSGGEPETSGQRRSFAEPGKEAKGPGSPRVACQAPATGVRPGGVDGFHSGFQRRDPFSTGRAPGAASYTRKP